MKVTVCELTNNMNLFEQNWSSLVDHVRDNQSDLVLLPEMPFFNWLAHTRETDPRSWQAAVDAHKRWLGRLDELSPAWVVGTRPIIEGGNGYNEGFIWHADSGYQAVHRKYYLPDEPEFWEASWYSRGEKTFQVVETAAGTIGFLICTEIWFNAHAREYAGQGIQLLICPRATPIGTEDKWVAGGRVAAVVSGAYCLSSNLVGQTDQGGSYGGRGWIIEPEVGDVLGITTGEAPFITLDIDLGLADKAKQTYPRYVLD